MLYRRGVEFRANALVQRIPFIAILAENAHLDQLVREQIDFDFMQ